MSVSATRNYPEALVVRLTTEMHREIAECAAAEDRTMAQTVRRAIRLYLESGDRRGS